MARLIAAPNLQLPWSSTDEDDRQFWKIFRYLIIPAILLSIAIPFINVPEPKREELEKLPPQLAKVVLEQKELPKPTPRPTPKPTPKPKEKEEPKKEEPKEEPKKEPKKEDKPKPTPKPEVKMVEKAREQAQAEINQFADALSDMRDSFDLSDVNQEVTQSTGKAAEQSRDIITSGAKKTSGGVNTSNLSRNTGGVALSGKSSTKVDSKLDVGSGKAPTAAATTQAKGSRSEEEIRAVMEKHKNAFYKIYHRALRKNPALEGKVVFKIEIDGNGKVINASIVSSDLKDADLERKLIARMRLITFGAKNVGNMTINYDLDFLPY
ncbi:hypothetical protein TDB9533_01848 [Thalassocella blandensis]|nr:hypothetical protein TDB9533_01848 [Thalassocella blandensis]